MVHVYSLHVAGQDFCEERWRPYLSDERRTTAKRRMEKERRLCLGAEVLLNLSLERLGVSMTLPAAYVKDGHGKPYLQGTRGLYVNWSHSGEYVLCTVADREVGVDIQRMRLGPGEALVRRLLRPEEKRYYDRADPEERLRLFYRYWVAKESFLKALGTGFAQDLGSFWVDFDAGEDHPAIIQEIGTRSWDCRILRFHEEDYMAAVCLEGRMESVDIEELTQEGRNV